MNRTTDAIYEHLKKNKDTDIYRDLLAKSDKNRLSDKKVEIFQGILNATFENKSLSREDFKSTVQSEVLKQVVM
jgi:hypothetical protein